MKSSRPDLMFLGAAVLLVVLFAGLTWGNYQFTSQNPGGNDFVPRWVGTRLYLTEGFSPYSVRTTREIQRTMFGRLARPGEDQALFVYPYYSMLVFAPLSFSADYALVRALWMTAMEISLVAMAFISLAMTRWQPPLWLLALYLLFALIWYHAIRPVINGNPSVIVALFITLVLYFVFSGRETLAGVSLALATIKPQMVVLLVPFVLWWAFSHRKMRLIYSFLISMAVLVIGSMILQPDWITADIGQILIYPQYTLPGAPGPILESWWGRTGAQVGWGITIVLALILLREWFVAYGKDERWFLWTAGLTLVITNLIGIRTATANYIALFPVLALVFSTWEQRWKGGGRWLVVGSMLALFFGLWWLFLGTLIHADQPLQHPIMFFPLPLFLLLTLYWTRYWALGSRHYKIEQLNALRDL